jgi:hypothetical protein
MIIHEEMINIISHQGNIIKPPLRFHLTQVRMVIVRKKNKKMMMMWRKGTFFTSLLVGM